jgi:glycerol-3-phosphate dehydrogenase
MPDYDVLIVGGGINGVGAAQAATAAGHKVLLLEKTALAAGTSSRSSKLIHGGLRYLETAQFRLVRESLYERRLLLRNAPDLVKLLPFYVPVYETTSRTAWQLRAGLSLYALLGGMNAACRFDTVPRRAWDRLGGLKTVGLQHVFRYHDAQTDDAELTRAVMKSAQSLGAELVQPAHFEEAEVRDDEVIVRYSARDKVQECSARVLVNAGGPWAARIAHRIAPRRSAPAIDLIRGTHILVGDAARDGIFYVENPADRRAVFVMPRGKYTLLGTTETVYPGDPDQVGAQPAEIDYLLNVLRHYFERSAEVEASGVIEVRAGLRVLPAGGGTAFGRSRETMYDTDDAARPRAISIYGGKLTTYRATAQQVLARIAPSLPSRRPIADTRTLKLEPA